MHRVAVRGSFCRWSCTSYVMVKTYLPGSSFELRAPAIALETLRSAAAAVTPPKIPFFIIVRPGPALAFASGNFVFVLTANLPRSFVARCATWELRDSTRRLARPAQQGCF